MADGKKEGSAKDVAENAGLRIAVLLEDRTMSVADLLRATSQLAVATAWAAGQIEFGCRTRVLNGQPGKPDAQLIVECSWNWTGEKKSGSHVGFRELYANYAKPLPDAKHYREYPDSLPPDHDPNKSPLRDITRPQAEELLALQVRLTDKGLALLGDRVAV